jgi:NADH:ubiquinone oxidoreductase subunit K
MLSRGNAILILMGLELILNAANLNLVAFSRHDEKAQGQMLSLWVIVVAVCETVVALAIILQLYQYFKTTQLNRLNQVREKEGIKLD